MTDPRFEELLGELLDGELTPAAGDELAAAVRAEPVRRRELRQHLVLWELWSQQQAPERSAEAFLASWRTRLRAESHGEAFLAALKSRISRAGISDSRPSWFGAGWDGLRRPAGLVWASAVAVVALTLFVWLLTPHRAEATILRGEAVCPACTLHEGHVHAPALRVHADGTTHIYYLEGFPKLTEMQGYFCSGPNPITVEGTPRTAAGRASVSVSRLEVPPPNPKTNDDQRILFPL